MSGNSNLVSRRTMLALGATAAATLAVSQRSLFAQPASAPAIQTSKNKRFKVAGDDPFLNNRQKLKAFTVAQKAKLDGLQLDMGSMPGGKELKNALRDPAVRDQFVAESKRTGVEIASLAWLAQYAPRPY